MSDTTDQPNINPAILRELSDIKAALAVNTSETGNIKTSINEIKGDMKEIKMDFVNRREFNETTNALRKEFADANTLIQTKFLDAINSVKKDIALPKKILYGILSVVGLTVLGALLRLVIATS
jgi:hypothetical protein